MEQRIAQIMEEQIIPLLKSHGGGAEVIGCKDGIVRIALSGACAGCPSADLGTKDFIEETLKKEIPDIRSVELVQTVPDDMLEFARRLLRHGE